MPHCMHRTGYSFTLGSALGLKGLTDSSRVGRLHLLRVENVIHAGSRPTLNGTMQDDQGLLWHAWMHEGMYPAHRHFNASKQCWCTMSPQLACQPDSLKFIA